MKVNVLILISLCIFSEAGITQTLDGSMAFSQINLRNLDTNYGHNEGGGNGQGFIFRIGIDSIPGAYQFVRYELGIKKEYCELSLKTGGQGGTTKYNTEFEKTALFIGAYPLNLGFAKYFQFSAGIQGNILLHNNHDSYKSSWSINGPNSSSTDSGTGKENHNLFYLSITLRQSISIPLNKKLSIEGLVYYSRSSAKEFDTILRVSSRSFSAGLGMAWKL